MRHQSKLPRFVEHYQSKRKQLFRMFKYEYLCRVPVELATRAVPSEGVRARVLVRSSVRAAAHVCDNRYKNAWDPAS